MRISATKESHELAQRELKRGRCHVEDTMPLLELQNLTQRFGDLIALDDLSLSVEAGEFVCLLGPSGCGKTTTIRLIAGFLTPTAGRVLVSGSEITHLPPEKRNIGMVFQSYALFPHLNVFENVAFGLRAKKTPKNQVNDKVKQSLALVNLSGYESRTMTQLSGGEQQRVAIARTLVTEPQILLLDEPLSNLDAILREQTRKQLKQLTRSLGMTAVFVTHDQEEAFSLSDRIVLLSQGVCQQAGTAHDLYHSPANEFVARFIGKSNLLPLPFQGYGQDCLIFSFASGLELRLQKAGPRQLRQGKVYRLLLRPEAIQFEKTPENVKLFEAKVVSQQFTGAFSEYELEGEGLRLLALRVNLSHAKTAQVGGTVSIHASPEAIHLLS
jgi:ABC-type Fe3+/spermidine/putrescine transport system ATPase subunit